MSPRPFIAALALSLGLAWSTPAAAQDVAASEAQFERGLAAMQRRDFATACPAIEESYRLDPRPGTMFTLAECENQRGRTATAATRYEDYLSFHARLTPDLQQRQGDRPRVAAAQRDALRARAPKLTIAVPPDAPPGTNVSRDGVALTAPSWGVALPVDPGEHVVRLEAPGHAPVEQRITIADGQSITTSLALGAAVAPPPPGGGPTEAPTSATPGGAQRGDDRLTGVQTGGLVLGAVGIVGLGVGSVFGLVAMGHAADADEACPGDASDGVTLCESEGAAAAASDAADAAETPGALSTIAFGVGAAALVGGVLMFALGGDDADEAASGIRPVIASDGRGAYAGARGSF